MRSPACCNYAWFTQQWPTTRSVLLKSGPPRTELLAITDECVGVALCVYVDGWRGAR